MAPWFSAHARPFPSRRGQTIRRRPVALQALPAAAVCTESTALRLRHADYTRQLPAKFLRRLPGESQASAAGQPPAKRRQARQAPAPHDTPPPCANLYRIFSAVFARLPVATARGLYQLLQQPEHRQMRGINAIPHPGGHAQVALPAQEHQRQRQNRQRLRA